MELNKKFNFNVRLMEPISLPRMVRMIKEDLGLTEYEARAKLWIMIHEGTLVLLPDLSVELAKSVNF